MYKAQHIDFAYLKGDGTLDGLRQALKIVQEHRPRGFCVNPSVVGFFSQYPDIRDVFITELRRLVVLRQFVIDFPLGQGGVAAKYVPAKGLVEPLPLADEFDVVANIGALLSNDFKTFQRELRPVIALRKPVKVIVETGYYPDREAILLRALEWCVEVGAFAIKTSTGFIQNLDNETKRRHVAFWRKIIERNGYKIQIKDVGGKKTREDIDAALEAGADIIGASSLIE